MHQPTAGASRRRPDPRRLMLAVVPLALIVAGARSAVAVVPPPSAMAEPVGSWLVQLDGPSLHQRLSGGGSGRDLRAIDLPAVAEIRRLEQAVLDGQAPVVRAVGRLGGRVISRYAASANGLLVHATAGQAAAIGRLAGVARLEAAPLVRPLLGMAPGHVGARRVAQELGIDGTGSVVAIIDTGVDYTHGHLGGPGTAEAFQFGSGAGNGERVDDRWNDQLLFPNAKVIGGYDFVGPRYNPPHICTDAMMLAGTCTNIPEPDADPLDAGGHGTHVAGIVAGRATATLADGVAPGAQIVGLKLYGTGGSDEAADVLVDAIEWTYRVNVKIEDRGVIPPQVDAINISLGENWAQGSRLFDEAVSSAVDSGVIVVASAGNAGDQPFVVGAPSASPRILSVASSLPPMMSLQLEARWEGGSHTYPASDNNVSPLANHPRLDAPLAWMGRACADDPIEQDVREKIALIARGDCIFQEKVVKAQTAGAIGVVMFTNQNARQTIVGDEGSFTIPAVMIDRLPGETLRDLLVAGTVVGVVLDAATLGVDHSQDDVVSGFSSRGPSKNGALKPDITAPGSSITSAAMGSGQGGATFSGTSMASPMVAGTAALMQHRNRKQALGLGAADLAAMMMNYARPVIHQDGGNLVGLSVTRQGAGLVDNWRAASGSLVVRAGDIASLNLGGLAVSQATTLRRTVQVKSAAGGAVRAKVSVAFPNPDHAGRGVDVTVTDTVLSLQPGEVGGMDVVFQVDPARLRPWASYPSPAVRNASLVQDLEVSGQILVTPLDEAGQELAEQQAAVPFYVLPRAASAFSFGKLKPALQDQENLLKLANIGQAGAAHLFMVPRLPLGAGVSAPQDEDEPAVLQELDLKRVGARFEPQAEGATRLAVAVVRHEAAAIPHATQIDVYIDADRDGAIDHLIREKGLEGQDQTMLVEYGQWDPAANEGRGGVVPDSLLRENAAHRGDLHSHLAVLSAPAMALGIDPQVGFRFYVVTRPAASEEDWASPPHPATVAQLDVAPDGADQAGGPRYDVDPRVLARVPEAWSLSLPSAEGAKDGAIRLERGPGEVDGDWLLLFPSDDFAASHDQMGLLRPGGAGSIYLPFLTDAAGLPGERPPTATARPFPLRGLRSAAGTPRP